VESPQIPRPERAESGLPPTKSDAPDAREAVEAREVLFATLTDRDTALLAATVASINSPVFST